MNHHTETPPAKKQRASDDESEAHERGTTSSPQRVKHANADEDTTVMADSSATSRSALSSDDVGHAQTPVVEDAAAEVSGSSSDSSSSETSPRSNSIGSNGDLNEESFLAWLLDQKSQGVGPGQMLDVLGLGVSEGVAVDDDELWDAIISMGLRLIQPSTPSRKKLPHVNTLQDVVELLRKAERIVVLAGAGISVSCGIPDFRSENGIYSRLGEYNLPNPQCMFDIEFFRTNPRPFFAFAKELFPKSDGFTFVPSRSHYFLKLLEDKGKLLRIYSQVYPGDAIREDVMKQQVPMCRACGAETGIVKPDIVFFGESLPRRFHDSIRADENEADLVLVMGSSLKVNPVRSLVGRIHKDAPMILINRL
ncbi:hypothetical protein P43SY_009095 [Pythium insidiosum]|uniref:protein acetyllysine N-acetyltransferase n=1 Tax=Pythium insidiosum TaxID=114742 RepID=A0AAD5LP47_PYTIN|nr:hypothetical protein P43SY_009095 [Pythium insidiosum]